MSCISQDFLSPPMAAGLPSFGCIGLRLLLMLRLGMARVAHFVLQDLGGRLPCFWTGPLPCFRTGQAHSTGFHSRYPCRLDYRVSCASGHVYCPCSGSASRQRHLVLLDLAAGLQRPRRPGIFNTEFPPATFSSQPRFRRLVGQSEFQSGADFGPSSHFAILIARFSSLDSELSGASAGDSDPAVCGIHPHDSD